MARPAFTPWRKHAAGTRVRTYTRTVREVPCSDEYFRYNICKAIFFHIDPTVKIDFSVMKHGECCAEKKMQGETAVSGTDRA